MWKDDELALLITKRHQQNAAHTALFFITGIYIRSVKVTITKDKQSQERAAAAHSSTPSGRGLLVSTDATNPLCFKDIFYSFSERMIKEERCK